MPIPDRPIGGLTWCLRHAFSWLLVRPTILVGLGLNVRHRERLPADGPAILVANHNSHLDTLVLMSLLPYRLIPRVRPVAAADYFLSNPFLSWFSRRVIGIIPVRRGGRTAAHDDPLAGAADALESSEVVILFPEGTRGEPEERAGFKSGVAHLAKRFAKVPVVPVFLHGLGKTLPKGRFIPVPFFVDVVIGEPLHGREDHRGFIAELERAFEDLDREIDQPEWF
jgi:1-acyl-sn-glycerol-3-phosphate acyltransferase